MASNSSTQNNEKAVCSIERSRVTKVKVSVAQVTTVFNDTPATMEKAKKYVAEAAENGSKLVVFPEGFIGGYPRGSTFGNTVGYVPTREGGEQYRKYHASAIDVPGPEVDELGSLANQYDIYIVIGVIERDGYTLYCTVLFFDPKGNYLGKHRKIKPTTCERVIWGCGDGSTIPVFDTPIGKLGAVICWENRMPLLRTAMYAKGIELYCAPTADFGKSCEATMIHIAVEGGCFVLCANQFCQRKDFPKDHVFADEEKLTPDSVVCDGVSVIVSPMGEVLAGPVYDAEAILSAELDFGEIARAKLGFDAVGHYARPDILSLIVNEHQLNTVKFTKVMGEDEDSRM